MKRVIAGQSLFDALIESTGRLDDLLDFAGKFSAGLGDLYPAGARFEADLPVGAEGSRFGALGIEIATGAPNVPGDALLLEDGQPLLAEDGDFLLY
jgi:hypothetical protein